jgi:acyl phosphate:glycerol-3-phosphate acyltransferase
MITGILLLLLAYVAGSFPSGLIIGKTFYHVDLRDYGSHNIGATNAYRVLGKAAGAVILLLDTGKGVLGVYLGQWSGVCFPEYMTYTMIAGGLLAIAGHSCSLFLKFKGGKGVATGLGVILYLAPQETLIVFIIWAVIVMITRFVSLGSIVAALFVPITMYLFDEPTAIVIFGVIAALFVIIRHKDNIVRLLHGKELKVKRINKN